jgi:hypothetical protein
MLSTSARVSDVSFDVSHGVQASRTGFFILALFWILRNVFMYTVTPPHQVFCLVSCVILTIFQIIPSLLYLLQVLKSCQRMCSCAGLHVWELECIIVIGSSIGFSVDLVMRSTNGPCEEYDFASIWWCNPTQEMHQLTADSVLLTIMTPVVLFGTFAAIYL